ncbi:MAG: IclR family transcriptional regulator [Propionibacteriales bacterium]|nr:IclR family transcriptional regulator [Propionibacteriales bacterium]
MDDRHRPRGAAPGRSGASSRGAEDVLRVLGLLTRRPEPMPAAMIASVLGLPRSSAYRLLGVLVDHGFVALEESGGGPRRYGLGVAAHELGSAYTRQAPLQRAARPVLIKLVEQTTQSGHFAVLHGRDVLYLLEERAPGRPSLVTDAGVRLPAPLTASGLALLAAEPNQQVRALYPDAASLVLRTNRGPTTPSALRRLLVDVRRDEHASEDGTVAEDLSSVAAAVRDFTGQPVASFAVTYRTADVDRAGRAVLVGAVRSAAVTLSTRLGHRTPGR